MYKKLFLALAFISACSSAQQTTPVSSKQNKLIKGSMANQKLVRDAMLGMMAKLTSMGCSEKPLGVQPYIAKKVTGKPGSREWLEMWSVFACNKEYRMMVQFKEDGKGAAHYTFK